MLTLYALLCIIYIVLITPSKVLKKLFDCEKNNKQLVEEIKFLHLFTFQMPIIYK